MKNPYVQNSENLSFFVFVQENIELSLDETEPSTSHSVTVVDQTSSQALVSLLFKLFFLPFSSGLSLHCSSNLNTRYLPLNAYKNPQELRFFASSVRKEIIFVKSTSSSHATQY